MSARRVIVIVALFFPIVHPFSMARAQLVADIIDREVVVGTQSVDIAGKTTRLVALSESVSGPFTGVAIAFRASSRDAGATVRFSYTSGWTDPEPMHLVRSATSDVVIAGWRSADVLTADRIEVTIVTTSDDHVVVGTLGVFDNRQDDDRRQAGPPGDIEMRPLAGSEIGTITPPPLITRTEWGARDFIGTPVPLANPSYDAMTFHHAAGYSASNREEGLVQLRAIQDLHQNVRGWSDIGYQFVIDKAGNLYQGRPFLTSATSLDDLPVLALGAHAGGANTGNIGISLLGCYHPPEGSWCEDEITPAAYETYITLFAFLSERYGVAPNSIFGHRDFGSTSCPGDNNYVLLATIKTDVATLLQTGNAELGEAAMVADVADDGVVTLTFNLLADHGISGFQLERWIGEERVTLFDLGGPLPTTWADGTLVETGIVQYRLYALASNGRRQLMSVAEIDFDNPAAYALAEAFPNPSSSDIRIRYYLRDRGHVRLAVYNALGRQVSVLANAYDEGERWNVVTWPTVGVSPGVYTYRITVEGFSGIVFDRSYSVVVLR